MIQPPIEPSHPEPDTPEALCPVCAQPSGGRCLGHADCPLGAAPVASTDATGGRGEAVAWSPEYLAQAHADLKTAFSRNLPADFPNYAMWSVELPAGHWRAILAAHPIAVSPVVREAWEQIGRMKLFPDDKINRTTLQAAIHIARQALSALTDEGENHE